MTAIDTDGFNAFEAAAWERQAATYESFLGRITARLVVALLDAAAVGPGTRLLDIGTGPGHMAAQAAERGAAPVGVDVSEAMLAGARAAYPTLEFRHGDAEQLPFPDASFDAVVGGFVLLHIGRPERAARELGRVLARGGRASLTVWDLPERNRMQGIMLDAIADAGATAPDLPVGPPMFRFAEDAEFVALLEAHLVEVVVETESFTETIENADELWYGLLGGSVRLPPLVTMQTEAVQAEIRERFDALLENHRSGGVFEVPVSVKLASGRKER